MASVTAYKNRLTPGNHITDAIGALMTLGFEAAVNMNNVTEPNGEFTQ